MRRRVGFTNGWFVLGSSAKMLVGEEKVKILYYNVQYNAGMVGGGYEFKVTVGIGKL